MAETFPIYITLNQIRKLALLSVIVSLCKTVKEGTKIGLVWIISGDARPNAGAVAGGGVSRGSSQGRRRRLSGVRMPSQGT
jgi:hypothetical protein